ncbi:hypothetical protein [Sphingobacterium humi]|uniref:Uncharacterized protein n=1 Tax=Sphingobacterium humi TaxID=1796905 RepID=A0A6N8L2X5_9SPHI|nr:hypothetical protein [Sphingobacterium humi]MVZ62498.1 hypothetical protein [Sphingobacterium humi]
MRIVLIGVASLFLLACNQTTKQQAAALPEETEHHHAETSEGLVLNQGEKWPVNAEMKPYAQEGEALINQYQEANQTDYKQLALQLSTQNKELVKSCTMDGKAHEELHKWLHPHLTLVKDLETASSTEQANELIEKIKQSYATYHEYFN